MASSQYHQYFPSMNLYKLLLSFIFLHLHTYIITSKDICMNSACSHDSPAIRFPFRIQDRQSKFCGYPGFKLSCDDKTRNTLIELPYSGKYIIREIHYSLQEVWINDPNNCLPEKILSFNLSGSPFKAVYCQTFTFFSCQLEHLKYRLNPIACLSNTTHTVFATSSPKIAKLLLSLCHKLSSVSVPVQQYFPEEVYSSDLGHDLRLRWDVPECGKCESEGGRCGFNRNSVPEVQCSDDLKHKMARNRHHIIAIGVGVFSIIFICGLVCFIFCTIKSYCRTNRSVSNYSFSVVLQPIINAIGLNKATIESLPKLTLGVSRRLPKPDDNVCSICLCEYQRRETLKTLPSCHHCFHACCIDEWLHRNGTCPICRSFPEQSPLSQPSARI